MYQPQPGWAKFGFKLVIAVAVTSAVLLLGMHFMPAWDQGHMLERFLRLGALVAAGNTVTQSERADKTAGPRLFIKGKTLTQGLAIEVTQAETEQ